MGACPPAWCSTISTTWWCPAVERLPENLLERVQPYDLSKLCRYQAAFLSGFISEKPAVDVHKGWEGAKKRIDSRWRQLARRIFWPMRTRRG